MFPMGNEPTNPDHLAGLILRLRAAAPKSNTPALLDEAADAIEDLASGYAQIETDPRPVGD